LSVALESQGGAGAVEVAKAVQAACLKASKADFRFLYETHLPLKAKIETIAKEVRATEFAAHARCTPSQFMATQHNTLRQRG
jgi:formyltetrahydrofolate synthetase